MSDNRARLLIWERTGRWARWWREVAPAPGSAIHELRGTAEVQSELHEARAAFLAIECEASNWEARCQAALNWLHQYGQVRWIVLSRPELAPLDPLFREFGALAVAYGWRDLVAITRLAQRHLAKFPSADRTLQEKWLDRIGH